MNKNYKRIAITLAVLILGYLNYYKEEDGLGMIKNVIETTNVTYNASGYQIIAQTQIDDMDLDTTKFLKANVDYEDLNLSGDKVFLDVGKNLFLEENIIGQSGDEWEIRANDLSYNQYKDILTTKSGIEAINLLNGLKFRGQELKTNKEFSELDLDKNVVMENDKVQITGDKGRYTKSNETFVLVGEGKFNNFKEDNKTSGSFRDGKYLLDKGELVVTEEFQIDFPEGSLKGKNLNYNSNTESFVSTNNPVITLDSYVINANEIRKESNENLVRLVGNLKGRGEDLDFVANTGYYDLDTKVFYLEGDIEVKTKKGEIITADKIDYNTESKLVNVTSKTNLTYKFEDVILKSTKLVYNLEDDKLKLDVPYTYENSTHISEGEKFEINQKTKVGYIQKGYVKSKENNSRLSANMINFNLDKKDYRASEDVILETESLRLTTTNLDYITSEDRGSIKDSFVMTNKEDGSTLESKNLELIISEDNIKSSEIFIYKTTSGILEGKGLVYNLKSQEGNILSEIRYRDKSNNTITGDKGRYKAREYFEIQENVKVSLEEDEILTSKAKYSFKTDAIIFEDEINLQNKNNEFSGKLESGEIDNPKKIFTGNNFTGSTIKNEKMTSKSLVYNLNSKEIKLQDEVKLESPDYVMTSDSLVSSMDMKVATARGRVNLKYGVDGEIQGKELKINNETKDISGINIKFITKDGNSIEAVNFSGNMNNLDFFFRNNVRGSLTSENGEKLNLRGENLKISFMVKDGKYQPTSMIGGKNTKFINDIYTFTSNDLRYNFITSDMVSNGSTNIDVLDDKTRTNLKSKNAKGNLRSGIINFASKITVENRDKENKLTTLVGDSGVLNSKAKTIEVKSNVTLENEGIIFKTDKMIYNKNTEKVKAYGKTNIIYKNAKGENL